MDDAERRAIADTEAAELLEATETSEGAQSTTFWVHVAGTDPL